MTRKESPNPYQPGGRRSAPSQPRKPVSAAVVWLWGGVAGVLLLSVLAGGLWHRAWKQRIAVGAEKSAYLHYEIVTVSLSANDKDLKKEWTARPPVAFVEKDGQPVVTIGRLREMTLAYDAKTDAWLGRWPVPWNAPEGEYLPRVSLDPELQKRIRTRPFKIDRRVPTQIDPGFVAVNLETDKPLRTMKVRAPDGTLKGWEGLLDWAQYFKADAFWVLAGVTPGTKPDEVWLKYNLPIMKEMGAEAHRRGLKFGVWAMCYLTSKRPPLKRYKYAVEYSDGKVRPTRSISIADTNRADDLVEFYRQFAAMPEVDYVGLDYIRNALGGYELGDEFFREMPGAVKPAGWDSLDPEQKAYLFQSLKVRGKDKDFIERFQWWRAHRIAGIVTRVKAALPPEKILWAFTLGWQRGWQHGQDPVMMNDAGVDVDAVMLYESTGPQFDWMVKDWSSYLSTKDSQLIVADVIDWPLHQYTVDPSGPEDYARRMRAAIDGMYKDGRVKGIFIHDLSRLFTGRKGPYSTSDWAQGVKRSVDHLRKKK